MRSSRRYSLLTVVLVAVLLPVPARADLGFQTDPTDQSDSRTDVAGMTHDHQSGRGFEHEVSFDGSPSPDEVSGTTLHFSFTNRRGRKLYRRIYVETDDGVTLRGRVTSGSRTFGYVDAQMDDPSTLAVRFTLQDLHARRARSYRWLVWTVLGVGEFDEPCSGEDRGPPVCMDRAPTTGRLQHLLR